ncbi:hypothetical protein HUJ04_005899 [Dendroctonus ponderosae]|nr:hypothetical protein HUJ04_005899 [Dendroctonus ponderosae]
MEICTEVITAHWLWEGVEECFLAPEAIPVAFYRLEAPMGPVVLVEYVLGTSPTGDKSGTTVPGGLEPRMRVLHLDDKDHPKDKVTQQSPKDEQGVNGQNSQQQVLNGQEDDKGFK